MALGYREHTIDISNEYAGLQGFIDMATEATHQVALHEKEMEELNKRSELAKVEELDAKLASSVKATSDLKLLYKAEKDTGAVIPLQANKLHKEKEEL